jgi:gamma-glutamyltranspeptidase / glutathione hydrolase
MIRPPSTHQPFALSWLRTTVCALCACLGAAVTSAQTTASALQPEAPSGYQDKAGWSGQRMAVAAANPLATQTGWDVLRAGGCAVDAAIATQMVLGLVEPQSSGLGGGAFMVLFDGQRTHTYDGRETAPGAVTPALFLQPDGQPMPFWSAVVGGRSVGTPGLLRMLAMAHERHGCLPWASLFAPAVALAEQGFAVSPRLNSLLSSDKYLRQDPTAAAYFYDPQGQSWPVGHVLRNPALASTLRAIAARGPEAFYTGDIAQTMVDKVTQHATNPGVLSLSDLVNYQAVHREALCFDQAGATRTLRVCGMGPPSSGTLAIGQIMGLLDHTPAASLGLDAEGKPNADWLHLYLEASRLAFADRAVYVADPDFVSAPGGDWSRMWDRDYLRERAQLIGVAPDAPSLQQAQPGNPAGQPVAWAPMPQQAEYGTSHISIVDAKGQGLAMTTTIESAFGARQMVGGFLLNNELTDFSFQPADDQGRPIANRVEPRKRPRSSMSPTLVFDRDSGALLMSLGSPGGAFIIHFTAKTLWAMAHWGLTPQEAVSLPNFGSLNGPTVLEAGGFDSTTVEALRARGAPVREVALTSGLQALQRNGPGQPWRGGADPRREGVVLGE